MSNRGENKGVVSNAPGDQVSDLQPSSNSSANSDSTVKLEDLQDAANDQYVFSKKDDTASKEVAATKSPDVLSS